jgi:hypothetical protein
MTPPSGRILHDIVESQTSEGIRALRPEVIQAASQDVIDRVISSGERHLRRTSAVFLDTFTSVAPSQHIVAADEQRGIEPIFELLLA